MFGCDVFLLRFKGEIGTSIDPLAEGEIQMSWQQEALMIRAPQPSGIEGVRLMNLQGQSLWVEDFTSPMIEAIIPMDRFVEGIYLLQVQHGGFWRSFKVQRR